MTITIENEASKELPFDYKALIERVVMGCMDYEKCPYEAEVNVLLTNNEEIHKINKEYRGIDRPTDVLSFPMVDYDKPANFDPLEMRQRTILISKRESLCLVILSYQWTRYMSRLKAMAIH